MASVMPKVSLYAFLSIICLMINISLFMTGLMVDDSSNINSFTGERIYTNEDLLYDNESASISDFAFATGGSFIPFYSLVTIKDYIGVIPDALTVITGIIIGIISAFQIFLLSIIIINMIPKVLGSGFDV